MNENKKSTYGIGGLLFVGFMFLGMGLGYIFNDRNTGMYIGMGVGFIAMGILSLRNSQP